MEHTETKPEWQQELPTALWCECRLPDFKEKKKPKRPTRSDLGRVCSSFSKLLELSI